MDWLGSVCPYYVAFGHINDVDHHVLLPSLLSFGSQNMFQVLHLRYVDTYLGTYIMFGVCLLVARAVCIEPRFVSMPALVLCAISSVAICCTVFRCMYICKVGMSWTVTKCILCPIFSISMVYNESYEWCHIWNCTWIIHVQIWMILHLEITSLVHCN